MLDAQGALLGFVYKGVETGKLLPIERLIEFSKFRDQFDSVH